MTQAVFVRRPDIGARVQRGYFLLPRSLLTVPFLFVFKPSPDWKWENQDGGAGKVGTILEDTGDFVSGVRGQIILLCVYHRRRLVQGFLGWGNQVSVLLSIDALLIFLSATIIGAAQTNASILFVRFALLRSFVMLLLTSRCCADSISGV